jgi:hypothetical protein
MILGDKDSVQPAYYYSICHISQARLVPVVHESLTLRAPTFFFALCLCSYSSRCPEPAGRESANGLSANANARWDQTSRPPATLQHSLGLELTKQTVLQPNSARSRTQIAQRRVSSFARPRVHYRYAAASTRPFPPNGTSAG